VLRALVNELDSLSATWRLPFSSRWLDV